MDLDRILINVEKPSRYTGGEWNACYKEPGEYDVNMAFMFPDTYEVGMSHLGLRILYEAVNTIKGMYMERVFAPWVDMEEQMRNNGIPLFTLETKTPVKDFDIISVTLQYEMSYTNILNMLDLAGVPLKRDERDGFPLVIAGGPCASNSEPLSDFVDVFNIGDGEEHLVELMAKVAKAKNLNQSKDELLQEISEMPGCYVPKFYDIKKDEEGRIIEINSQAQMPVRKNIVIDLDKAVFPAKYLVPNMGIVHDRITLEIMRGCTRGCRFCQAGYIYRPIRERSEESLVKMGEELIDNTGYNEISLSSLSSSDYSHIEQLMNDLTERMTKRCVSVALPSLRLDSFSRDIIRKIPSVRKTGLTFAPEAGTQRLRDVINKNVTEDDLIKTVRAAFELGWSTIKLYFMIGLPTETMEDIDGIIRLAQVVADEYEKVNGKKRGLTVTVSTSTFVPKSNTPFMWFGQEDLESIKAKQDYLKDKLRARWFKYNWHDPHTSMMEAVFARGGRELGAVLLCAYKKGCRFDSWAGHFKLDKWLEAFEENGLNPFEMAKHTFDEDEILPWDMISYGVTKDFLLAEKHMAERASTTGDCRAKCLNCGLVKECAQLKKAGDNK